MWQLWYLEHLEYSSYSYSLQNTVSHMTTDLREFQPENVTQSKLIIPIIPILGCNQNNVIDVAQLFTE